MPFYEIDHLPSAPTGTYKFLEELNGAELRSDTDRKTPLHLMISKEEICDITGGSCMAFRLVKKHPEGILDIHGHVTDDERVVFLFTEIYKEGTTNSFPQKPDIDVVLSEIRAILPLSNPGLDTQSNR